MNEFVAKLFSKKYIEINANIVYIQCFKSKRFILVGEIYFCLGGLRGGNYQFYRAVQKQQHLKTLNTRIHLDRTRGKKSG